jgi:uncharacterized cupin superfamily protein
MYLSAQDIESLDGIRKPHFLNPQAIRLQKSLGDAVGLKRLGAHLITIDPGQYSTEFHAHVYEEEMVYILSGRGLAAIGDKQQPVGPGDFIGYPTNGIPHDVFNDGEEPLVFLVVGQRLDQDVCDYPRKGKRLYTNHDEWDLVDHANIQQLKR